MEPAISSGVEAGLLQEVGQLTMSQQRLKARRQHLQEELARETAYYNRILGQRENLRQTMATAVEENHRELVSIIGNVSLHIWFVIGHE